MKVIGWKVWYGDGSKHAGTTLGEWEALPEDGVIVVMLYYDEFVEDLPGERYRRVQQGNDIYWVAPGGADFIYGQGDETPDIIRARYPGAIVKTGRWTDDGTYKQAVDDAMADQDDSMF